MTADVIAETAEPRVVPGLPNWTWESLERDLLALAHTPSSKSMVAHLVEGTRLQASFLPAVTVAREVAAIILAVTDPSFPRGEGWTMT